MNKPECKTYPSGTKEWLRNGVRHREEGPAYEEPNGIKEWYIDGKRHRKGGPAAELPDGTKWWYLDGVLHREDGPSYENPNGDKGWWLNGENIHPETLVDLWLERGVPCWYDEANETLNFVEDHE